MRRILLASLSIAVLATLAEPAHAQYHDDRYHPDARYDDRGDRWDVDQRIRWVEDRIEREQESGWIDRDQAWRARNQLEVIRTDEQRIRVRNYGRLPDSLRLALLGRVDSVARTVRWHDPYRSPWEDR